MNVLSLFDGISCGQIALERANIKVDKYFASEIDKYAISVTQKNYSNTIQLGDITKIKGNELPKIDLLIGGSPCQGFSFAGKQLNFEDERSKLFFEYVRLLEKCKPKYFLLENVKMKKEYQDIISKQLDVEPILINSSLVSAQNRKRLYWTNIRNIKQPKNENITLSNILEKSVDKKYFYSEKAISYLDRNKINKRFVNYKDNKKSTCLTAVYSKCLPYNVYVDREKSNCILANYGNMSCVNYNKSQGQIVFHNNLVRKLTPTECERLQTISDNYTKLGLEKIDITKLTQLQLDILDQRPEWENKTIKISNTQRYKMLGNGWTVDVISHIFKNIVN